MNRVMNEVLINPIPSSVSAYFTGRKVNLSENTQQKIEKHWESLISQSKNFKRGSLFTIQEVINEKDRCLILLQSTDYAHYLYTIHQNPNSERCKVLFTSALVETKDHYYVMGEMDDHTSTPRRIQCAGGGISKEDLNGSFIDLERNIRMECLEEIGVSLDSNMVSYSAPLYLKSGGDYDFLAVIWKVDLNLSKDELLYHFKYHRHDLLKRNELPEFRSLVIVPNSSNGIRSFIENDERPKVDYLKALLKIDSAKRK